LPRPCTGSGTILVFGDSLSAGYGIRQDAAWPALLAKRLQEKRLDYSVVNASISGETTSGGRTRIDAALARHSPQVVIVALGANDGLRGPAGGAAARQPGAIVASAQKKKPRCCWSVSASRPTTAPMRCSSTQVFAKWPKARKTALVDFLLDGVATQPALFQADNLHPTAEAQPLLLDNVWRGSRHC
jgi:acyl-CoA thioesterase-1